MDSGCDLGDGGPDLDFDGVGFAGADGDGVSCFDVSSYSFDGGDVDTTAAEALGESAGDMSSMDYSVTDSEDGNPLLRRFSVDTSELATMAAHVVGHCPFNMQSRLDGFAKANGLVRMPWILVGGRDVNQVHDKLLPLSTWDPRLTRGKMSAGWYQGATGTTTVWRRYYCVGKRTQSWNPFSPLTYDRDGKTYIVVTGITWEFEETGDCESHVMVKVGTLLQYDRGSNCYFAQKQPLAKHNQQAHVLRASIYRELRQAHPSDVMIQKRSLARLGFTDGGCVGTGASEEAAYFGRSTGERSVVIPA